MWIVVPGYSASAPESEDSISASDWRFQALEQSAWSRGKPRASKSWHRGWKTGDFIQRLFGRMPEPSMADRGVAEFMESLPVIPASHSASQASDKELTTRDTSGPRFSASLAKWDPSSCSWRMSQDTFDWASTECSVILPKSGSTRSGRLYERPMSEPHTEGSESSSWPTAVVGDSKSCGAAAYSTESGRHSGTTLTDSIRQWPTPRALDGEITESPETWGKRKEKKASQGINLHLSLQVASRQWPTPRTITGGPESAERKKELGRTASGGGDLQSEAAKSPTPNACISQDGEDPENWLARRELIKAKGINGNGMGMPITIASVIWATPTARDWKDGADPSDKTPTNALLGRQAPRVTGAASPNTSGLRLNPNFVEWLMGFPEGWTVCEPSATLSSRSKQHSRSDSSSQGSNNE